MSGTRQPADGAGTDNDDGGAQAAVEARALRMGWQPREKYRGPADRWVPAGEFIERGERMMPLLLERNKAQDRQITDLQRQIQEATGTLSSLVNSTRRAEQIGYNRAMRELAQRREKAVTDGDTAEFRKVEAEIAELGPAPAKETAPPPPPPGNGAQPPPPEVTAWVRQNPWFNRDPVANAAAVATLSLVEKEFPGDSLAEHLEEVTERMKATFPQHFEGGRRRRRAAEPAEPEEPDEPEEPRGNQRRRNPPMTMASNDAPPRSGGRTFDALPVAAKREYERQKRMLDGKGEPFTKEEYARYYWEAEGEAA